MAKHLNKSELRKSESLAKNTPGKDMTNHLDRLTVKIY